MKSANFSNLTAESFLVSRNQKEMLNGHRSFTVWLTGLPASGKSTVARLLEEQLYKCGIRTAILDGDNTRIGLNRDLDFSTEGRKENIRRVAEVAKLMNEAGVVTIACFISPMASDRSAARKIIGEDRFIEVFIDAPLEECIKRDPKNLYKKALNGEISDFTGVSSPYEIPLQPDIHVSTMNTLPGSCAHDIYTSLQNRNLLQL